MRIRHLKIKIKSLAAEARIIRAEEQKLKRRIRRSKKLRRILRKGGTLKGKPLTPERAEELGLEVHQLKVHRKSDVREEARHSLLAYGYMRGTPYKNIEQRCEECPSSGRIASMVNRFGGDEDGVEDWLDGIEEEEVTDLLAEKAS
jgi:hypothetical protein